jgi:hypothetical protein
MLRHLLHPTNPHEAQEPEIRPYTYPQEFMEEMGAGSLNAIAYPNRLTIWSLLPQLDKLVCDGLALLRPRSRLRPGTLLTAASNATNELRELIGIPR